MQKLKAPGKLRILVSVFAALALVVGVTALVTGNTRNQSITNGQTVTAGQTATYTVEFDTYRNAGETWTNRWYRATTTFSGTAPAGVTPHDSTCTQIARNTNNADLDTTIDTTAGVTASGTYHVIGHLYEYSAAGCAAVNLTGSWTLPGGTSTVDLNVNVATPTLTWDSVPAHVWGDAPFGLVPYVHGPASNPGTISFSLRGGSSGCTLAGAVLTITDVTTNCRVRATIAGNAYWAGPVTADTTLTFGKATPTLTFTAIADHTYGNANFGVAGNVTKPADDTGAVTFATGTGSVGCSVTNGGTVSITGVATGANSCIIVATVAADGHYNSATATRSFHINKADPTLTFPAIADRTFSTTPFTISGVHGPTGDTGAITYATGTGSVGCSVGASSGQVTMTGLATGTDSCIIVATIAATANFNSATASQSFHISKATPTVTFSIPDREYSTSTFNVASMAHVTAGDTGAVTFALGGSSVGCTVTPAGVVTMTGLATGASHCVIVATVAADANFNEASTTASFNINKASTTTTLTVSNHWVTFGQPLTYTVTVTGGGTGTVELRDFWTDAVLATATLSGGTATFTMTPDTGLSVVEATYAGDSLHNASTSNVEWANVDAASPTLSLTSSANPSSIGQPVTFTATLSVPGCTGTITFRDGATTLGTATPASGSATLSTGSLGLGSHSITASYGGDGNCNGATSPTVTQVVNLIPTTTTVVSSLNPSDAGQSVTFTATVTAGATGTVTFMDGATPLGSPVTLAAGEATVTTAGLSLGHHSITATYSGDPTHAASSSSALDQVVNTLSAGFGFDLGALPAKVYGSAGFSVVPFVSKAAGNSGAVTFSSTTDSAICTVASDGTVTVNGVGTCEIVAAIEASGVFAADTATASFTIGAATLHVTADSKSITKGTAVPAPSFYTYQVTGWVKDADKAGFAAPVCTSTYADTDDVGSKPITCSYDGNAPVNYVFDFVNGTLNITAPAATPTPTPTAAPTATPTATPAPTEVVGGVTAAPSHAITPPPTTTSGNGGNGSNTLPFALLICLAFSGFGLLAVTAQRRGIRP